jgi:hypothetical protein
MMGADVNHHAGLSRGVENAVNELAFIELHAQFARLVLGGEEVGLGHVV